MPAARTTTRYRDRRSNNPNYNNLINDTISQVNDGQAVSFNKAAERAGIPRSTVTDRAKNRHADWKTACQKRQLLTPEEEAVLLSWAAHRGSIAMPFSPAELRAEASAISGKPVGRNWHKKFERRHPELYAAKPVKLDPKRAKNFNEAVINDYFDKLEALNARFPGGIPPEHIWNMDEKGIQMGGGRKKSNKKFYFLKSQKQRYRLRSDNLELVTILECISAAGDVVPPSFCMQNGALPDLRHELKDEEWGSVYFSGSGWTDTYNCEQWLEQVFIPFAKKKLVDPLKPIVLTMDGHGTHETPNLQRTIYKCLDNDNIEIVIFCFPSKCTHKCQPLDVSVFSSVERKWQDVCDQSIKERLPINRFTIIPQYIRGTREALSRDFIKKAFEQTGIYPVRRTVFTKEDFAPSKASSCVVHVPEDFPDEFPSSDPIEIDPNYEPSIQNSESDSDSESETDNEERPIIIDSSESSSDSEDDMEEDSPDSDEEIQQNTLPRDVSDEHPDPSPSHVSAPESFPALPASGILHYLANIETGIIHMTRSASTRLDLFTTAPPRYVSEAEDRRRNYEEMFHEVRTLRKHLAATDEALRRAIGQISAANAHCTSIHRELGSVRLELENATQKKQPRSSKKVKARFLTSAAMREEFEHDELERQERQRTAAEKDKQKEADAAQRTLRIADEALNRVFVGRIGSYKKDDLKALALSLSLSDKGTNLELSSRIQDYFDAHPDLKTNSRFSGLFQQARRRNNAQPAQSITEEVEERVEEQRDVERSGEQDDNRYQQTAQPHLNLVPETEAVADENRTAPPLNGQYLPYHYPNPYIHPHYNQPNYPGQHLFAHPYYHGHTNTYTPPTANNLQINYYKPS